MVKHIKYILFALTFTLISVGNVRAQPAPQTIASQLNNNSYFIKELSLSGNDLRALYNARNYKPIWNTESERGRKGIITFLASLKDYALYHGLNTDFLPFKKIDSILNTQDTEYKHVTLEIMVTDLIIKLTRRIRGDDLDMKSIYKDWPFPKRTDSYLTSLIEAIETGKINEYFQSLLPSQPKYKRLALVLKTYRSFAQNGGWDEIPYGATIKENREDSRLPLVYKRLKAEGYEVPETVNATYTPELQEVVMLFQSRNGLKADGEIGTQTIRAMNISAEQRVKQLSANMERIRQIPISSIGRRIEVNTANAQLKVYDDKEITYEAPVIVGSRWRKTPFIHSEIKTLILNPSWYVPDSIARNDILKKLKKNPYYLKEKGYNIEGNKEDPQGLSINWADMTPRKFKFFLRQAPSDRNALGKVKFNFKNKHAVYLHGTPKIKLFDETERHLSSGCVRLKEPVKFAEMMLEGNVTDWSRQVIESELSKKKKRWLTVVDSPTIQFIYDSAYFPTDNSPVHFNRDIYHHDKKLIKSLFPNEKAKETIKNK